QNLSRGTSAGWLVSGCRDSCQSDVSRDRQPAPRWPCAITPVKFRSLTTNPSQRLPPCMYALSQRTTVGYDAAGRNITVVNANGEVSTTVYDIASQPLGPSQYIHLQRRRANHRPDHW